MLSDTNVKIYYWWKDGNYGKVTKKVYSALMSFPIREIQLFFYRKDVLRQLEVLKIATDEDAFQIGEEVFESLSGKLGEQKYFFGDLPSSLDAIVFGHLACQYFAPMPEEGLRAQLEVHSNLVRFVTRMSEEVLEGGPPSMTTLREDVAREAEDAIRLWNSVVVTLGVGVCMWLFVHQRPFSTGN